MREKCDNGGRGTQHWEAFVATLTDEKLKNILTAQRTNYPDVNCGASQRVYNRVVRREARKRGFF